MMNIHCLVQVNGTELDFAEWLDYHIALGFDAIFVFSNGDHPWLNAVCERRADKNVVVVPGNDDWSHQSTIVEKFVARRKQPSWAICLSDDEFIWLDPKLYRGVKDFVFGECERRGATACTLYTKYMSSKEPMKSRVGTLIDCFTHTRREPEGYMPSIEVCPNTGATFFKISGPEMPLVNRITPKDAGRWMDANGSRLLPEEAERYMHSKQFFPMRYRARIYRFCPKSGFEMLFADKAVPRGFDVQDLSMQEARSLLIHVPVNPDTEKLFAKDVIPLRKGVPVENSDGTTSDIPADELAERALPVTKARICKMILSGKYFEDIRDEVVAKYQYVDVAALERVFNKEREAIIQADTSYRWLRDLLDEGKTEEEICKAMLIKHTAYVRMVKALPVLDIPRENTAQEEETAGDPGLTLEVGKEESMEDLATKFNESVESHRMTELEKQEIDNFEKERSIRKGAKKGGKPRKKDDKTPKKPKVVAVEAIDTGDTGSGVVVNEFVPPTDADDFHLDVESDLIDSASSDSVIKHATEGDAENA